MNIIIFLFLLLLSISNSAQSRAIYTDFIKIDQKNIEFIRSLNLIGEDDLKNTEMIDKKVFKIFRVKNAKNCRNQICRGFIIFEWADKTNIIGMLLASRLFESDHIRYLNKYELVFLYADGWTQAVVYFDLKRHIFEIVKLSLGDKK